MKLKPFEDPRTRRLRRLRNLVLMTMLAAGILLLVINR